MSLTGFNHDAVIRIRYEKIADVWECSYVLIPPELIERLSGTIKLPAAGRLFATIELANKQFETEVRDIIEILGDHGFDGGSYARSIRDDKWEVSIIVKERARKASSYGG